MVRAKQGEAAMEACASVSGGVMFVPEKIERRRKPFSYADFADAERMKERERLLVLRKPEDEQDREAA